MNESIELYVLAIFTASTIYLESLWYICSVLQFLPNNIVLLFLISVFGLPQKFLDIYVNSQAHTILKWAVSHLIFESNLDNLSFISALSCLFFLSCFSCTWIKKHKLNEINLELTVMWLRCFRVLCTQLKCSFFNQKTNTYTNDIFFQHGCRYIFDNIV